MVDEFIAFLVAGLVILAALLAIFSGEAAFSFTGQASYDRVSLASEKNFTDTVLIGEGEDEIGNNINMGAFSAGYEKSSKSYSLGSDNLYNGLFFGTKSLKQHIDVKGPEKLIIKFAVKEANGYGPLIIKINGAVVSEDVYAKGNHAVYIEDGLPDEMDIEIEPFSSLWKTWAPNIYELENVKIDAIGFSDDDFIQYFSLSQNEYDNFKSGKIELSFAENFGSIKIKLNDDELFSGPVPARKTIFFSRDKVFVGTNKLTVEGEEKSFFSGSASVSVFHIEKKQKSANILFNIKQSEYANFKSGKISFKVVDVAKPGAVSVKVKWGNNVLFNRYEPLEEKIYEFSLDKKNIATGVNYLVIDSLDDSTFYVKDISVKIAV